MKSECDLNLPGLFRNAYGEAINRGRTEATIIVSESQKDQIISALSETEFNRQHGATKIFPIPGSLTVNQITIHILASTELEEGTAVIE